MQKKTTNYWDDKFWAYMHDPFDKAFDIKGHIERAKKLTEIFGIEQPNEQFWKKADGIASGFERGQIVSYHKDESKSGAVDFLKSPIITHPTGEKSHLQINLPDNLASENIWQSLKEFVQKDIGMKPGDGGYSDKFVGDEKIFSIARFFYTHLLLRFRLSEENIGNIGALWHRIPADTRFPDHSIWQHNALVSAINSCLELGENEDDLGLMIFSITPVQGFISNARKLRDYWTGSILLSWLAFEGIKWVIENLGPDHVVYPSLIDQSLINEYLIKNWKVNEEFLLNKNLHIASFPNKFLFLIPFSKSENFANEIENSIKDSWNNLVDSSYKHLLDILNNKNFTIDETSKNYLKKIFERQNKNFWELNWVAVKLLNKENKDEIENLLISKNYKSQFQLLERFLDMIKDKQHYDKSGIGILYSISHSLCQSALAAQKIRREIVREEEPGEKCQMCGEFEVLHCEDFKNRGASEYSKHIREFWDRLNENWKNEVDFKENERLCSICFIKRIAYQVLSREEKHILNKVFKGVSYESTTEIALYHFFEANKQKLEDLALKKEINLKKLKKEIAQHLYQSEEDKINLPIDVEIKNRDKYYAILLMDGDNMGKLINGETIASTWESIMHPDILEKIKNKTIEEVYCKNWQDIFKNVPKRNITPAIHLSISEALGDFAVYGVSLIIKKYNGKLIYAGGDDVCAVVPVNNVIFAADEIQKYYKSSFRLIYKENNKELNGNFSPEEGKLSVNLGKGKDISISAGILICHHKESLSHMIKMAHALLDDKAKKQGGRNCLALQLRKRSGGDRFFIAKWDSDRLNSLKKLQEQIGENISRSLAYKLKEFEHGLIAIKKQNRKDLLELFILQQLKKSGLKTSEKDFKDISKNIINVIFNEKENFDNTPLIIAGFLSKKEETNA